MKRLFQNKAFTTWISGFVLITVLLWIFVLRFPGYIFYWDLSGAFSLREPFAQYFNTYTPFDGTEVGLKNRIPLVSIFWVLTRLFMIFGFSEGEIVIKFAVWFLFIGAYTAFYIVIPHLDALFARKHAVLERTDNMSIYARVVASLLYLALPFFSYRISQFHLFYFTTFYPLVVYTFIKLLQTEKKDVLRWCIFFALTLFFGITSPHSILYYGLTLLVLFIAHVSKNQWSLKLFRDSVIRMIIAGGMVVVTNLYWLIPYVIEKAPAPGYVVSTDMITFLSQNSTFPNYIFDVSEWFLNQTSTIGAFLQNTPLVVLQYVGVASLYGFALLYIFSRVKHSPYVRALLFLLVFTLLLGVKDFPGFSWIYSTFSFSSFGWIIREPNRIRFLWTFWIYVFSVLGFYQYIITNNLAQSIKFQKISGYLTVLVSIVAFVFYIGPSFITYTGFLKPTVMSSSFSQVQQTLSKEPAWGTTYFYPRKAGYGIGWKKSNFPIADEVDYLFLPYNFVVPPAQKSGVLASGVSIQESLMDSYLAGDIKLSAKQIAREKIEYIVIASDTKPLYQDFPSLANETNKVIDMLTQQKTVVKLLIENPQYTVFQVLRDQKDTVRPVAVIESPEGVHVLSHIETNSAVVLLTNDGASQYSPSVSTQRTVAYNSDNTLAMFDYLSADSRSKYTIDVYSHVLRYISPTPWGRMSLANKVNGEATNILNNNGLRSDDRDIYDKVIFADSVANDKPGEVLHVKEIAACKGECVMYARIYKNTRGGELTFSTGSNRHTVSANASRNTYQWVKVGAFTNSGILDLDITVDSGFQSIAQVLLLPQSVVSNLENIWAGIRQIPLNPDGSGWNALDESVCASASSSKQKGLFENYLVTVSCPVPTLLQIDNWSGNTALYVGRDGRIQFIDLSKPIAWSLNGWLYLVTFSTIILWVLFISDIVLVVWALVYLAHISRT